MAAPSTTTTKSGYVYRPPENSYLFVYVLNPFYSALVQWYPTSWTPNGITVFGIICTFIASAMLLSVQARDERLYGGSGLLSATPLGEALPRPGYPLPLQTKGEVDSLIPLSPAAMRSFAQLAATSFDVRTAAASTVLIIAGILNLVYCTADNTDGKQARRLKLSSPIGEYLDHGLDCVTSLLSTYCLLTVFGLSFSCGLLALFVIAFVTTLSHALHYHEGVFIFGGRWFSVDEAMIAFGVGPIAAGLWPSVASTMFSTVSLLTSLSKQQAASLTSWNWTFPGDYFSLVRVDAPLIAVGFSLFLLGQLPMVYTFLRMRLRLAVDRSVLIQLASIVFFTLALNHHVGTPGALANTLASQQLHYSIASGWLSPISGRLPPVVADFLVDPLILMLTNYRCIAVICCAFVASIIVHVHIAGRCLHLEGGGSYVHVYLFVPVVAVLFWVFPVAGMGAAIVGHFVQISSNIAALRARAALAKKQ